MKRRRSRGFFPFDTSNNSVETEQIAMQFAPFCRKWTLRALIELGAHRSVLHDDHCSEPGLIRSLGVTVDLESEYEQKKVLAELKQMHRNIAEHSLPSTSAGALMKNIAWLAEQLNLNEDEQKILFFCVLERQSVYLRQIMASLGAMNSTRVVTVLSVLLEIPLPNVHKAFSQNSGLTRSGLVTIDDSNCFDFCNKMDLIEGLAERLILDQENPFNLFADNFVVARSASLELNRFEHMKDKLERLTKYLGASLRQGHEGVNILVYGPPGTGKTECVRAIAKELDAELFEVAVENRQGDRMNGGNRMSAYRLSQRILAERKKALIIFDEIEDINSSSRNDEFDFGSVRSNHTGQKGWFNQLLEHNRVPAIWVTNNIRFLDPAHLRRFDYHLQMEIPPARIRSTMLEEYAKSLNVSQQWCVEMAANEKLSPGVMSRAAKVAKAMNDAGANGTPEELLEEVIESALKVQKFNLRRNSNKSGKVTYQLDAINADCNLNQIIEGLRETKEGRLCLYGAAGTGKSAFAQYVAAELDKPVLLKRASDILGKYVGETEERMAQMFKEADQENAVLILDEADSFLRSREGARQNWEISAVNEMLTQMESFQGIFFATTNLMDQLDSASLRRFDAKINFGYLKFDQCVVLFDDLCKKLSLESNELAYVSLRFLDKLTPGDFSNVLRQARLRPMRNASDLIDRLTQEMSLKKLTSGRPMGFLAQAA